MLDKKYIFIAGGGVLLLTVIIMILSGGKNESKNESNVSGGPDFETEVVEEENVPMAEIKVTSTIIPTVIPTQSKNEIGGGVAIATLAPTIIPTLTPVPTLIIATLTPTRIPEIPTPTIILPTATPTPNIIEATGVSLSTARVNLYLNEKQKILTKVEPDNATNKSLIWNSNNNSVVTVDNDGLLIATGLGKAVLTVRTSNNKTNTVEVEIKNQETAQPVVTNPVTPVVEENISAESISLNIREVILGKAKRQQITVVFTPNKTTNKTITWSSDNESVAKITESGLVTAVESGMATITARTRNGKVATAKIIVPSLITNVISTPTVVPTTIAVPTVAPTKIWKFVYDENDTKPYMKCNTYTANDRIYLENLLKQAVDSVGRGTRAGVVEAARFLAGGLDYKVPYLGPKKVDSILGRYSKEGLNIGNSKGWGCRVSGWTQGVDCTNFVDWAIVNGGLSTKVINPHSKAVPFAENVSKVNVGDFLLTLSNGLVDWTYSHTSIIIGIDENYFYIAEARGNGTIVSKMSKKDLPSKNDRLGMVSLGTYPAEGKLTNMWNQ